MTHAHALAKLAGAALASAALFVAVPALAQNDATTTSAPNATTSDQGPATDTGMANAPPAATSPDTSTTNGAIGTNTANTNTANPTESVASVTDAKTQLAAATVQDQSGQQVGQVQDVHTSSSGKATRVDVALNTPSGVGKVVSLKASQLGYDPSKNIVVAQLSRSDIESMPAKHDASDTQNMNSTTGMNTTSGTANTPPTGTSGY